MLEAKQYRETLCFEYKRLFNLNIKIVRIFNTYGPYLAKDDGRVISNFIINAIHNKDLKLNGNGSQTRSFCYVDDLVRGLVLTMKLPNKHFGPFNLGNPNEITVKEVAHKIINITNSKSKIKYDKLPSDDPKRRRPNINLAKKIIKWKPKISLEKGLALTIKYFKKI